MGTLLIILLVGWLVVTFFGFFVKGFLWLGIIGLALFVITFIWGRIAGKKSS